MTRIDFYILEADNGNREQFACRIAEKAYRLGHGVYIHTADAQQAGRLDDLLWTFKQNSFIPHGIDGESPDPEAAVLIGHNGETETSSHAEGREVLINLDQEIPLFFSSFKRVAEVIDQQVDNKNKGRKRYKFYRDRGYSLETHTIS
jgi:DNA polymerase-3 subunit chi